MGHRGHQKWTKDKGRMSFAKFRFFSFPIDTKTPQFYGKNCGENKVKHGYPPKKNGIIQGQPIDSLSAHSFAIDPMACRWEKKDYQCSVVTIQKKMIQLNRILYWDYQSILHGVTGGGWICRVTLDNGIFQGGWLCLTLFFLAFFLQKWEVLVSGKEKAWILQNSPNFCL